MGDFEDLDMFGDDNSEALAIARVEQNLRENKYTPLPRKLSQAIRVHYRKAVTIPMTGSDDCNFFNKSGTLVARGYARVVIGDYGAYIEFRPDQMCHGVLMNKIPGEPNKPVKYIWKLTKDRAQTKVYEQRGTVTYADYQVGMYYIGVDDVEMK